MIGLACYPAALGITFVCHTGRVTGLELVNVELERDASGRMAIKELPGTEKVIPADMVLLAMGFLVRSCVSRCQAHQLECCSTHIMLGVFRDLRQPWQRRWALSWTLVPTSRRSMESLQPTSLLCLQPVTVAAGSRW